ncbi:DUF397 domain-containing protein [Streptomyces sp. UNOB3_S3]|uniref:DUF397 domain-containing protein n=1 Tax=Streptomyces sp. UNOB3_S3 TaxID=2871682 RepID=UPI001E577C52|nr:DUF397 domain-containing protein [Streptomyces sp. UNOB3_S3]MCC3777841.1 DUF397 domain-containing protein [Streptomyces sp. UNOB3_S3]
MTHSKHTIDLSSAVWRKSSHSDAGNGCIEVADGYQREGFMPVRDSKDPSGPAIVFPIAAWSAFVADIIND